jgi:hypothetical protein
MTGPDTKRDRLVLWAGISGMIASLFWMTGDMLMLGSQAQPGEYPLLLKHYADQIEFPALPQMLPASEPRLAAGALVATLTGTFYLIGAWHLFRVARPFGRAAWAVFGLLLFGFANAPLGHAGFYFVGMLYKTIMIVPASAHPALLDLANNFYYVILIAYVAGVGGVALGTLLLALLTGLGRTLWPRWMALLVNPLSLVGLGDLLTWPMPEPLRTWLGGAGLSIGTLVLFAVSTWLVRHKQRAAA